MKDVVKSALSDPCCLVLLVIGVGVLIVKVVQWLKQ